VSSPRLNVLAMSDQGIIDPALNARFDKSILLRPRAAGLDQHG
jgi:hypothetical protein